MTSASFQRTQLADELWGVQREDSPLAGVPGESPGFLSYPCLVRKAAEGRVGTIIKGA